MTAIAPSIWDRRFPMPEVKAWVAGVLAGIYAPEPDEEIWEWAERTLRIPSTENEEMAGMLWSSNLTPYVRELMKWVRRPGKGEFWIKKSSQVGFTMAVLIIICWMIVHRPGNVAYAIDSLEEARKISKTRLRKWIENNRLLESIGEDPDDMSNLTYYLRGMTVYMMGSHSKSAWKNKSVTLIILDELDAHPYLEGEGTTVTLARERLKRPKNAKLIGFSTPGESDQITIQYDLGTKEEIRIPFPCCGHRQALHWKNLQFSGKEFRDLAGAYDREKVEKHAYFKCELCGGRLYDKDKLPAIRAFGETVPTNEKATGRVRSLHIWDAYSPFVTFGELASEWIDAQGDESLIERFYRGRLGEKFQRAGTHLKTADVLKCRGTYRRGTVPFTPIFTGQTIDIQKDVQKTVKFAVDERGNIYFTDWFISLILREAVEWGDEPVIGPDGTQWITQSGFIDEGHRAYDVRRMCLEKMPVFWPVKGRGGIQVRETVGTSGQWCDGQEILTYHIADDQFKWQLLKMIAETEKRGKRNEPRVFFPIDIDEDDDFLEELCNERPVLKKSKLGKEKWEWETTGPNDFWDCCKYAIALWTVMRPLLVREGMTR